MRRLVILLLICFGVSCSEPEIPKPDIDESINIEQTFSNSFWKCIGGNTFEYTYGKYDENLGINGGRIYFSKVEDYRYIDENVTTCITYVDVHNKYIGQTRAFKLSNDIEFNIKKRRIYGWEGYMDWEDGYNQEIIKLSDDTIALFDAMESIKEHKYVFRKYTVWARFTPDQELQQRMDNATEYTSKEFEEFDRQR